MRMNEGDEVICSNGNGLAALCEIEQITNESVIVRVIEWKEERTELPVHIYIAHGLPKGDKFELVIQKGTELGAFSFIPFLAARSVVKWEAKKAEKKARTVAKKSRKKRRNKRIVHAFPMCMRR